MLFDNHLIVLRGHFLVHFEYICIEVLHLLYLLLEEGEVLLVVCVGLLELTVLSADFLGIGVDLEDFTLYLLSLVDFVHDVISAALEMVN
jgi:hypothetical protein